MFFLPRSGRIFCGECYRPDGEPAIPLGRGVLTALRHTIYAEFDKLFSFQLPEEALEQLAKASEAYTLCRLERGFTTLDFYHSCTAVSYTHLGKRRERRENRDPGRRLHLYHLQREAGEAENAWAEELLQ